MRENLEVFHTATLIELFSVITLIVALLEAMFRVSPLTIDSNESTWVSLRVRFSFEFRDTSVLHRGN